jgi:hypothetical protein
MSIDPELVNPSAAVNPPIMGWQSPTQPRLNGMSLQNGAFPPSSTTRSPSAFSHMSQPPMPAPASLGTPSAQLPNTLAYRRDATSIGGQAGTDSRTPTFLPTFTHPTSAGAHTTTEMNFEQMTELQIKARVYLGILDHPKAEELAEKMQADPRIAIRFVAQMEKKQEMMAAPQKATEAPAKIVTKKRKAPSTAFEMPSPKRLVIDLADDNEQDPTDATHQPHTMQAAPNHVCENPTSNAMTDVLISDDDVDALRNYGLILG